MYVVQASRTAFGTFGGSLKHLSATELAVASVSEEMKSMSIDSCVYGNVLQTSADAPYLARHVALKALNKVDIPAVTTNRLCGSGIQAVIQACMEIQSGDAQVVLAGGTESMSQAPFAVRGTRFGTQLGKSYVFEDTLWQALTDSHAKTPMAVTAENLAEKYKITKEESDAYSLQSQERWQEAQKKGVFNHTVAIPVKTKKGMVDFKVDEHPRMTTLENLGKLKPMFKKDGVVTAGSASGVGDGAASLVIASKAAVEKNGWKPLAKVVSWDVCGVEPTMMGIGPAVSIPRALKKAGLSLKDMDIVEVNEAFAAQYLAVEKELGLDRAKTNVSGGAIALAHPLGASGARLLGHVAHQIHQGAGKYAMASACIGGGQGISMVLGKV